MIDLNGLRRADLVAMAEAGRDWTARHVATAEAGGTTLDLVVGTAPDAVTDWTHYPAGDVYDPVGHAQYFYHRHAAGAGERDDDGHIHTFLRPRGMPPGTRPLVMPELAIADAPSQPVEPVSPPAPQPNQGDDNDKFSHLVAIAFDARGTPTRLFTTNRWVTGETWYAAGDVVAMLDRFVIALAGADSARDRWLSALMRLYRPDIAALIRERDAAVMAWRRRRRGRIHVFEDRRLEIASSLAIDPAQRLDQLAQILDGEAPRYGLR